MLNINTFSQRRFEEYIFDEKNSQADEIFNYFHYILCSVLLFMTSYYLVLEILKCRNVGYKHYGYFQLFYYILVLILVIVDLITLSMYLNDSSDYLIDRKN